MITRKFPKDDLIEILGWGEVDGYELIDEGEWVDGGKYLYCTSVFEFDGKTYSIERSRSGSYFSDYYYSSEGWPSEVECTQVEKVAVTKYEWRAVEATPDAS